jgi:hypothetical protein
MERNGGKRPWLIWCSQKNITHDDRQCHIGRWTLSRYREEYSSRQLAAAVSSRFLRKGISRMKQPRAATDSFYPHTSTCIRVDEVHSVQPSIRRNKYISSEGRKEGTRKESSSTTSTKELLERVNMGATSLEKRMVLHPDVPSIAFGMNWTMSRKLAIDNNKEALLLRLVLLFLFLLLRPEPAIRCCRKLHQQRRYSQTNNRHHKVGPMRAVHPAMMSTWSSGGPLLLLLRHPPKRGRTAAAAALSAD